MIPCERAAIPGPLQSAAATRCPCFTAAQLLPLVPRQDVDLRARVIRQHRDEFEGVAVGVVEVDGQGRHPTEDHRPLGAVVEEVAGWQVALLQVRNGAGQHILDARAKGEVVRPNLCGGLFPESKHRFAARTDPIEGDPALLVEQAKLQTQCLAIEAASSVQVRDIDVRLKKAEDHR